MIYESPDKGETIFVRLPGELDRVMVHESQNMRSMRQKMQEDAMWGEIRRMAQTDPTMKDLADKMIMTYHLLKDK